MVFYEPAPRYVTPEVARQIISVLPPFVTPVGLFVDATREAVLQTARELGLRQVQLNGHETPDHVRAIAPLPVIKAIRVERNRFVRSLDEWREANCTNLVGFVLETAGTGKPGGTGVANDWETVIDAQRSGAFDGLPPIIAAGGLTPETVRDVVRTVRPYAVDVSSGVEASLRHKSQERVEAFVRAVREADAG